MRAGPLAAIVVILAGCSGPSALPPDAADVTVPPETRQAELDMRVAIEIPEGCNAVFCYMAGSPTLVHTVGVDEAVTSMVLELARDDRYDGPVEWELSCRAPDEEDPGCLRVLGRGRDVLPLHLEFNDLRLSPGTALSLLLAAPTVGDPIADMALGYAPRSSRLTGHVDSVALPPELLPGFEYQEVPVSWEGDSGPCAVLVDPGCAVPVGAHHTWRDLGGTVVGANLTLTWSSTSPADEAFRFTIGGQCDPSCPEPVVVTGRSPLRIEADGLDLGADASMSVYHADPTGTDPTGFALLYFGTKTPLYLEGTFTVRTLPGAVDA